MKLLNADAIASPDATDMACPRCKRRFEFLQGELIPNADGSKQIVCPACSLVITVVEAVNKPQAPSPSEPEDGQKDASDEPSQFAEGTPENPMVVEAKEPFELKSEFPNVGNPPQTEPQKTTSKKASNATGSTTSDNKPARKSDRGSKSAPTKSTPAKKAAPKKGKGNDSKGSKNTKASKRK